MNLENVPFEKPQEADLSLDDRWIRSRLNKVIEEVSNNLEHFELGIAALKIYDFIWSEFCDWYIEFTKADLRGDADPEVRLQTQRNLVFVLDTALRLLHPAMPFVTEAIWEHLPHGEGEAPALMVARWPEPETLASWIDEEAERAVGLLCAVVGAVRSTRARYGIAPRQELDVVVNAQEGAVEVLQGLKPQIASMARVSSLEIGAGAAKPAESAAVVVEGAEVYSVLTGLIDFDAERARLQKEPTRPSSPRSSPTPASSPRRRPRSSRRTAPSSPTSRISSPVWRPSLPNWANFASLL